MSGTSPVRLPAPVEVRFDLGGVPVSVSSRTPSWMALAAERYGGFATASRPEIRVRYRVNGAAAPEPRRLYAARQSPPSWSDQGALRRVRGDGFEAIMVPEAEGLGVEMTGPLAIYPIDLMLEPLWYLASRYGLVVHAAALADGDRGWLCTGPSGSGKSTLAGLFPQAALCDELAAVELKGTRAPRLASLPFWSGRRGSARLEGIYCLRHADEHARHRLTTREALHRLCRQVVWPSHDPELMTRALGALQELLERVPVWELGFRPEVAVWPLLSREAAA